MMTRWKFDMGRVVSDPDLDATFDADIIQPTAGIGLQLQAIDVASMAIDPVAAQAILLDERAVIGAAVRLTRTTDDIIPVDVAIEMGPISRRVTVRIIQPVGWLYCLATLPGQRRLTWFEGPLLTVLSRNVLIKVDVMAHDTSAVQSSATLLRGCRGWLCFRAASKESADGFTDQQAKPGRHPG